MKIFPAIDLYQHQAVRLFKGDYAQMTVYSEDPLAVARDFAQKGAKYLHLVDLEGARDGGTPHLDLICRIARESGLFVEVGGGIRSMEVVSRYLSGGVGRVILGTAAVTDPDFLAKALAAYGDKIAVGADVRDGRVAIRGWVEESAYTLSDYLSMLEKAGVRTVICTDISRDGAMKGTNRLLYQQLSRQYALDLIASGGVSTIEDVRSLREMELYGAIIGKAYYTGAIDLAQAIEVAK